MDVIAEGVYRASDALRLCVGWAEETVRGLLIRWPAVDLAEFHDVAARLLGKFGGAFAQADRALSQGVYRALCRAAADARLPIIDVSGQTFALAHEAVLAMVEPILLCPVANAPVLDKSFHTFLGEIDAGKWRRLGEVLSDFHPEDPAAYWGNVIGELRGFRFDALDALKGRLELECAGAVGLVGDGRPEAGPGKRERVTVEVANARARTILKCNPGITCRSLAEEVGCSAGMVVSLPAWRAAGGEEGGTQAGNAPGAEFDGDDGSDHC